MLTQDETHYISKIPADRIVSIQSYTSSMSETAESIISEVKAELPHLEIVHMGASGLRISGQGDLDIYALAHLNEFDNYTPSLVQILGNPVSAKFDSIAWEFERDRFPVEFYLTDPESKSMKRQLTVFKILSANPRLLKEYEDLKSAMNHKSFREYQEKKYEFYHTILGD